MRFENGPTIPRDLWPALVLKFPPGPMHPHLPKPKSQGVQLSCNAFAVASAIEHARSVARLPYVELDAAEMFSRVPEPIGGSYMGTVIEEAVTNGYKPLGRIARLFYCPTFDHQFSAVLFGWPLAMMVNRYPSYQPGPDGWAHPPKGTPEMHGIFGYKPAMRANPAGVWEYGIWHQDSTGAARRYVLSEEQLMKPVGSGGAFAVVSVHDEGVK